MEIDAKDFILRIFKVNSFLDEMSLSNIKDFLKSSIKDYDLPSDLFDPYLQSLPEKRYSIGEIASHLSLPIKELLKNLTCSQKIIEGCFAENNLKKQPETSQPDPRGLGRLHPAVHLPEIQEREIPDLFRDLPLEVHRALLSSRDLRGQTLRPPAGLLQAAGPGPAGLLLQPGHKPDAGLLLLDRGGPATQAHHSLPAPKKSPCSQATRGSSATSSQTS